MTLVRGESSGNTENNNLHRVFVPSGPYLSGGEGEGNELSGCWEVEMKA